MSPYIVRHGPIRERKRQPEQVPGNGALGGHKRFGVPQKCPSSKVPQRRLAGYSKFSRNKRMLFGGRTRARTWDPMIKRKRAPLLVRCSLPDDLSASVRHARNFHQGRFVTENVVRTVVRRIIIFSKVSEVADFIGSGRALHAVPHPFRTLVFNDLPSGLAPSCQPGRQPTPLFLNLRFAYP
jgi:hypothetical protein